MESATRLIASLTMFGYLNVSRLLKFLQKLQGGGLSIVQIIFLDQENAKIALYYLVSYSFSQSFKKKLEN